MADTLIRDPSSDASVSFAQSHESYMAASIPEHVARTLPPAINSLAPFTRSAVFGDTNDLYHHNPTTRIGANYTPTARSDLLERKSKGPPLQTRTGLETNAEILAMPAPKYPSVNYPPRPSPNTSHGRYPPRSTRWRRSPGARFSGTRTICTTTTLQPGSGRTTRPRLVLICWKGKAKGLRYKRELVWKPTRKY